MSSTPPTCKTCGKTHDDIPEIGFMWPYYYLAVPEPERATRCVGNSDWCIVDGEDHFIRGVLQIPVRHTPEYFGIGVWMSVSETNLRKYRANEPDAASMTGWLSTNLSAFPECLSLLCRAITLDPAQRPFIHVKPGPHPLARLQSWGITEAELAEVAVPLVHPTADPVESALARLAGIAEALPDWTFEDVGFTQVITLRQIIDGQAPVLHVTHDADDGRWQFLDGGDASQDDGRCESLTDSVLRDPTLCELADLPLGWHAWRESARSPWHREIAPEVMDT